MPVSAQRPCRDGDVVTSLGGRRAAAQANAHDGDGGKGEKRERGDGLASLAGDVKRHRADGGAAWQSISKARKRYGGNINGHNTAYRGERCYRQTSTSWPLRARCINISQRAAVPP